MIYLLNLRQTGWVVNHKRIERLYALAQLQVRRRKRKKIPVKIAASCPITLKLPRNRRSVHADHLGDLPLVKASLP
jgi:hypothetical protein